MPDQRICPCCGNTQGCDCYLDQSEQKRRIVELEARLSLAQRDAGLMSLWQDQSRKLEAKLASAREALQAISVRWPNCHPKSQETAVSEYSELVMLAHGALAEIDAAREKRDVYE